MNIIIPGLIAALAVWPPLLAKDDAAGTAASAVDFYARVTGVREVGVGGARPGLHLDAKVNGRNTDIYVAPINYLEQYGMTFGKGDDVHVIGSRTRLAGVDVVLAHEIAVGVDNRRTLYLRDDSGPFWTEQSQSGHH
jgi:hypothetical protein